MTGQPPERPPVAGDERPDTDEAGHVGPHDRWARTRGWTHRNLGDEVVLLSPGGELLVLDGASTPVFRALDEPGTVEQIIQRAHQRWPTRRIDASAAVGATKLLAERGVIETIEPRATRCWGITEDDGFIEVLVASHLAHELTRRWPPLGLTMQAEPPEADVVRIGRVGLGQSSLFTPDDLTHPADHPDEVAWGLLEQTLTAVAAEHLTHLVAIHSAVIAWNGAIILVPAKSGAGKSTLAMAAHQAGAHVLSDEYALVNPETGLVTGWRRPLRIRRSDGAGDDRVDVAVDAEPLPVGLVAAVTYEPGSSPRLDPMTTAETVLELLSHTIAARTRPDAALDAALAVSKHSVGIKGVRGEVDEAVADLLEMLDGERSGSVPDGGG